ncbi:MAG: 1-deoxy-D-xylulose-5-phosphate reductoisomerase [Bifidobacteriaceae bacterium]|nr:1-deoxy-D-xylulose-5-phosphate reductoisomerase [Bifidobacteriaceae bacterium]
MKRRSIVLLGSTGSIGTQALDVLARHPEDFELAALAAGSANVPLLARQVWQFRPRLVAVSTDDAALRLQRELATLAKHGSVPPSGRAENVAGGGAVTGGAASAKPPAGEIVAGQDAAAKAAGLGVDVVLNGITGAEGLKPTLAALDSGAVLALANKESLVMGGALVKSRAKAPDQIVPVDSEHSAIAQCLRAGRPVEVDRLILTASGGPFRTWTSQQMAAATKEQALAHPTWNMGAVVTINSATLINKALELIEAHLLFDVPSQRIDVVVHPQSVVHSMVAFRDGSIIAQASPPDMRLPIALGLSWPVRLPEVIAPVDFSAGTTWSFEPLGPQAAKAVGLARQALGASPLHPAVLNAANEVCVAAFLADRIGLLAIVDTVARVLDSFAPPGLTAAAAGTSGALIPTLDQVLAADRFGREQAAKVLEGA